MRAWGSAPGGGRPPISRPAREHRVDRGRSRFARGGRSACRGRRHAGPRGARSCARAATGAAKATTSARFCAVNVGGSLALLATAREARRRARVVLSSRAVFGAWRSRADPTMTRSLPTRIYGAAKAALEAFVRMGRARAGRSPRSARPASTGSLAPVERSKWFDLVGRRARRRCGAARVPAPRCMATMWQSAVWRLLYRRPESVAGRMFNCSDIVVSTRDIVGWCTASPG